MFEKSVTESSIIQHVKLLRHLLRFLTLELVQTNNLIAPCGTLESQKGIHQIQRCNWINSSQIVNYSRAMTWWKYPSSTKHLINIKVLISKEYPLSMFLTNPYGINFS